MARAKPSSKAVMDFSPWPNGVGFESADEWWSYVLNQNEQDRLDLLLMAALLSKELCHLLLHHDRGLLDRFAFSENTVSLLMQIEAKTLNEFVQALMLKRSADE